MLVPQKYKFIIQLGKALHKYGVPSYKSECYLTDIAEKKGINGSFMDTPTWINYVFYEEDEQTYNYVECVPPGEINLGSFSKIIEITNNVLSNTLSFKEAKLAIKKLPVTYSGYGTFINLLGFMFSAGSFSIILETSWTTVLFSTLLGAVVYGITYLSSKSRYIHSVLESLVALIVTIITGVLSLYFSQINIAMTILASIIIFIPGLSITTALEEITSKNLVSGTAKLADALLSLFKQFLGVVLGLSILNLFVEIEPTHVINDIPSQMNYFAVVLLSLALMPTFKVRKKDVLLGVVTGSLAFFITYSLAFTGILFSIFIGTLATVIISKIFSKLSKSPPLVFLVPGIVMLVPGSKAFIGLSTIFMDSSNLIHPNMGEQIFYIFMGIIGGLIFSGSFMNANLRKFDC